MGLWLYRDIAERTRGGPISAWLVYAIGIVALINFASYVIIAQYIGGDAINGHQAGGHYYLSNHGHLTEVSRAVFEYSVWHTISVFVTHGLAFLTGWLAFKTRRPSP